MKKILALAVGLCLASVVYGATAYNVFVPANGILKGSTATPVTTAAAWSDVQLLLSGTCDSSVFVRGDGTCVSLGITPAALTRTNDTNVTLTLGGTPSTALLQATSITAGWTGTLAASRGGLGMSTVTDDTIPVANGTTWASTAVPSCTDTGGNHLNYNATTNAFSCGTSGNVSGAALTKTDDTNVTLTLGGSPTTALVNAASITAGWTGTLAASRGGTGVSSLGDLTKADDTNVTLTLGGMPTGALVKSTSITAGWTGTLAASRGGLGMSTVTDDTVAVANGTTWQSKALPSCADSSGNHLNYDTSTNTWSCGTSSSVTAPTAANPTASVGLSAVNGSASTFMRSDGAPALSQSIAPTWTGLHTFTNSASGFNVAATTPQFFLDETGAATNEKWWRTVASSGNYRLQTEDDAHTANRDVLNFDRSGIAIASLTFGNSTDNPTYTFAGTGAITAGGQVLGPNGSASAPAYSFGGNTDTGLYRSASNELTVATGTADAVTFLSNAALGIPIKIGPLAAAPNNQTASYIAQATSALTGVNGDLVLVPRTSTNGSLYVYTGNAGASTKKFAIDNAGPALHSDGSASAPGVSFLNDTNSGIYSVGADSVGLATGGTNRVTVGPGVQVGAPTGGDQGAGTINATNFYKNGVQLDAGSETVGTFTGTLTGVSGTVTCSMKYRKVGSFVTLYIASGTCSGTSNATTLTMTGIPSAIQTALSVATYSPACIDNGTGLLTGCLASFAASSGTMTMSVAVANATTRKVEFDGSGWASSNSKGLNTNWVIQYQTSN